MKKSFTLIELMVVVAIVSVISAILVPSVTGFLAKGRDARRLADMNVVRLSLAMYLERYGAYPNSDYQGCGGWDTTGDGDFIKTLNDYGYLTRVIQDPRWNNNCGNYCYYRYSAGSYNCNVLKGAYLVLGVKDMETSGRPHPKSPGWRCPPPNRDWQGEFDWVVGKFEAAY